MKKFINFITSFAFVALLGVLLTGCGKDKNEPKELWSANLSDGNNNLFGIYGTVENGENFITLKPNENQNYADQKRPCEECRARGVYLVVLISVSSACRMVMAA